MKKGLLFLSLSALAFSLFTFNSKKSDNSENFIEYGYDAINDNAKVEKLCALKDNVSEGANKDAGNEASEISSKMGVQYGINSKGQTCMRFAVAIPCLEVSVIFNSTLTLSNGNVIYGQTKATSAYSSLVNGSETINPNDWNNQFAGADYNYFAVYTMVGIPESEYSAKIELSAEVTLINQEETNEDDMKLKAPTDENESVEVYNQASIADLKNGELLKFIQEIKVEGFDAELVDGKIVLTNYTGSDKNVVIPEGVTSIADGAFRNKDVKTVVIPNTVETIGEKAFYKSGVTAGSRNVGNDIEIYLAFTKPEVDEKVKSGEWDEDWATAYTTSPLGWGWLTTDHDAKILYKDQWHYDQNGVPVANR